MASAEGSLVGDGDAAISAGAPLRRGLQRAVSGSQGVHRTSLRACGALPCSNLCMLIFSKRAILCAPSRADTALLRCQNGSVAFLRSICMSNSYNTFVGLVARRSSLIPSLPPAAATLALRLSHNNNDIKQWSSIRGVCTAGSTRTLKSLAAGKRSASAGTEDMSPPHSRWPGGSSSSRLSPHAEVEVSLPAFRRRTGGSYRRKKGGVRCSLTPRQGKCWSR